MRKIIVISAVNIVEGGTLTVLRDCVNAARESLKDWRIIVMVHDSELIKTDGVEVRAFPRVKSSWLRRIWIEWVEFRNISEEIRPDIWLSLHDITPRVKAVRQVVYCHNPAIFYRVTSREAVFEPKLLLFNWFYGIIYRAFIHRNSHVIVQQQWIRDEFKRRFGNLPLVVAQPCSDSSENHGEVRPGKPVVFLYPALPRVFKNFEILGEAAEILQSRGVSGFEVRLTVSGRENRYAHWLKKRFGRTPPVRFIGRQNFQQMKFQYSEASAIVFPSKLETWGLPITEAKSYGLPVLVADAPYANETVGNYDAVSFFPPNRPEILANLMQDLIVGTWNPTGNIGKPLDSPFARNWSELFQIITKNLNDW
ncbi:glycosyltransferase [Pandoraea sp.]|uniref:glycosyltransferase n=1 Tax=Pandoraea sp. TaxID=1883445 RepID=UPI0035B08337